MKLKHTFNKILGVTGYILVQKRTAEKLRLSFDIDPALQSLYEKVKPYTMTTPERMFALSNAVEYVSRHNIPGAIVECGVYKGGSMMLCAYKLQECGDSTRQLCLYDTFAGMDKPTEKDTFYRKKADPLTTWQRQQKQGYTDWAYAPLEEVRTNMQKTGYHAQNIMYVKGRVEDTIPATMPEQIAILRLDTDFYSSTKHGLQHLFPRLAPGGVLIIDDYGSWHGCRQAVDEYFTECNVPILLTRCDHACAFGTKSIPYTTPELV